jgi:hypothetical protein
LTHPYISSVTLMDWNDDGIKDVIIGSWQDFVYVFQNIGTDRQIILSENESYKIYAEDGPIAYNNPYHALAMATAVVADFNQDGFPDVLVGGYIGAQGILYYENKGTKDIHQSWEFKKGFRIPGTESFFSSRVAVYDWNDDGIQDLIITTRGFGAAVYFMQVEWRNSLPTTKTPRVLRTTDGNEVRAPADVYALVPHVIDWDGDGFPDVLCSSGANYLLYYRNTGKRDAAGLPLLEPGVQARDNFGLLVHISGGEKALTFVENSSGRIDMVSSAPLQYHANFARKGFAFSGTETIPLVSQKTIDPASLQGIQFVDWFGRGNPDLVLGGPQGLTVYPYKDGKYQEPQSFPVDEDTKDWFGCPDYGEWTRLYPKPQLIDWNGDGKLDLVVVTEHSWRFGYIHLYENLGNWRFGPEKRIIIGGTHSWATYTQGKIGQGIQVTNRLYRDFLSYPTQGNLDPNGGSISFWHQNDYDFQDGAERYFFASQYEVSANSGTPVFSARKNPDGSLTFTTWNQSITTEPLTWKPGEWHHYRFAWGPAGLEIALDQQVVLKDTTPIRPGRLGGRLHIAGKPTPWIQMNRELPSRYAGNIRSAQQPLLGVLDEFTIADARNEILLYLPFDGTADGQGAALSAYATDDTGKSGLRMLYAYRSVPGFGDIDGDGTVDVLVPVSDGTRGDEGQPDYGAPFDGPQGMFGRAYLTLYRNRSTQHMGDFTPGEVLQHSNGSAFRTHYRTMVVVADWNNDGKNDILLGSEYLPQRKGQINNGLDLYLNESIGDQTTFSARIPMTKLLREFTPWHDLHLAVVDWFKDGDLNLAVLSDGGLRLFKRQYLMENPQVEVIGVLYP